MFVCVCLFVRHAYLCACEYGDQRALLALCTLYVCVCLYIQARRDKNWHMLKHATSKANSSVKWDVLCYNDAIYHSLNLSIPLSPNSSITVSVASFILPGLFMGLQYKNNKEREEGFHWHGRCFQCMGKMRKPVELDGAYHITFS